jgi:hypothetical protein
MKSAALLVAALLLPATASAGSDHAIEFSGRPVPDALARACINFDGSVCDLKRSELPLPVFCPNASIRKISTLLNTPACTCDCNDTLADCLTDSNSAGPQLGACYDDAQICLKRCKGAE